MCQFLSTCLVWKMARTPLPVVDKNNHLSKQFLSLFYKWKALAHAKSLLPSAKGLSFTFMLSLHLLPLFTLQESIVVILSIMCMVPKSIFDWFMIMVLLVLKLFVSNHPLKLECVLCIYVLLLHEGQAEYHIVMFFYMLETYNCLSMHYYSWSLVCVTFHVITWLLSSIVKIISFMAMFRVLWSQHSMFYIVLIKIVLVHVTPEIIVLLSLTYSRTSMS
jgi:hypothetical protein